MANNEGDQRVPELEPPMPKRIPYFRMVFDQGAVTPEIVDYPYPGSGAEDDPYVVTWIPNDPRNPLFFSPLRKWSLTMLVAIATLAVALISSAFSGGIVEIMQEFHVGTEVATLGISVFVLGFAIGSFLPASLNGGLLYERY